MKMFFKIIWTVIDFVVSMPFYIIGFWYEFIYQSLRGGRKLCHSYIKELRE